MALVLDTKKRRKKREPAADPELVGLATVLRALQPLTPEQRQRVMDYAARWVEAHAKEKRT